MSLRVDLHAHVRTRDGDAGGTVERVIIDPATNQIREFVVDTAGLLGRAVLVPRAEVEAASREGDVLRLRLSKADLEALPPYVPNEYVAPPVGWVVPAEYDLSGVGYLWPASFVGAMPYVPPAVPPASPDASAGAPAPDRTQPHEVSIDKGAVVRDRDGGEIGVVDDVRFDAATGQLMGFVLRVGGTLRTLFGGGERTEIARSHIDRVGEGVVHLRVTKAEVEQLPRRQTP